MEKQLIKQEHFQIFRVFLVHPELTTVKRVKRRLKIVYLAHLGIGVPRMDQPRIVRVQHVSLGGMERHQRQHQLLFVCLANLGQKILKVDHKVKRLAKNAQRDITNQRVGLLFVYLVIQVLIKMMKEEMFVLSVR